MISGRAGSKARIRLRIEPCVRQLIDDAAAVAGKTRTAFMIDSARQQAMDVLLDQRLLRPDDEGFDAFSGFLLANSRPMH